MLRRGALLQYHTIAEARIADGSHFVLAQRGDEWVVRVQGQVLMSNRMHDSEEALADVAIDRVDEASAVLVGGLGLGYTLRAVLDRVGEDAVVTVAELVPELVEWNRKYLGPLADHPLQDRRTHVVVSDVFDVLKRSPRAFDVILLDVDNGPAALAQAKNQRLYADAGVRMCHSALKQDGILAVWSSGPNARFERRMQACGFDVDVVSTPARVGNRARHTIFLGRRRPTLPIDPRRKGGRPSR